MFQSLIKNFARGLLFFVPVAATIYAAYVLFVWVDGWINVEPLLNRRVPGAGLVLTAVLITLVGFLAGNIFTRWLFNLLDETLAKVPLIGLVYKSLKDMIGAFVGEKKRFDRPVLVRIGGEGGATLLGFLTRDDMSGLGLDGRVAVYLPQAFNYAGNLVVVPAASVEPVRADSTEVMTFILSGGISARA